MRFYQRQKLYRYGARTTFFWKYKSANGRWKHGGQVYWGSRDTDAIMRPIGGIKHIAELPDGLERRYLIRTTPWLNRGVEDYSDEHFSKSIYLRLRELKKETPKLPRAEQLERPIRRQRASVVAVVKQVMAAQGRTAPIETLRALRDTEVHFHKSADKSAAAILGLANRLREMGQAWEAMTGHQRFLGRDFVALQSSLPDGVTPHFCRLALATWRSHPKPIQDFAQAYECAEKWWKLADKVAPKSR